MNFVFVSPHFPTNYYHFVERLHGDGVNVLGVGDAPYDSLRPELKASLTEYYRVNDMEDYDEMYRAVAFFAFKYGKIDWVESNNEYWLEQDAQLRSDFNITTGLKAEEIVRYKSKSAMKAYYAKAGVPTARYHMVDDLEGLLTFIGQVGWPVVAKPDNGVGASDTWKLKNESDVRRFFAHKQPRVQYIAEEFVDGETVTFDGISGPDAQVFYATSHCTPTPIMDMANEHAPLWYYVDKTIAPNLQAAGEATIKAFDARNRFFHCEFFRLNVDKEGLGKKGDIVGLEVNMRPAGGFTVDMLNFAASLDLYRIWADMVAFGRPSQPIVPKMQYCACASRRDSMVYDNEQLDILEKYRKNLQMVTRLPDVLAELMGNMMYIANFDSREEMDAFGAFVQAGAKERRLVQEEMRKKAALAEKRAAEKAAREAKLSAEKAAQEAKLAAEKAAREVKAAEEQVALAKNAAVKKAASQKAQTAEKQPVKKAATTARKTAVKKSAKSK